MPADEEPDWVETRTRAALEAATVADGTAEAVRTAMRGAMPERRMTAGELTQLARDILVTLEGDEE